MSLLGRAGSKATALILDAVCWVVKVIWFLASALALVLILAYLVLLVIRPAHSTPTRREPKFSFVETDSYGNLLITQHAVAAIKLQGSEPTEELLEVLTPTCRESLLAAWPRAGVTLICIDEGFRPIWIPDAEPEATP